MHHATRRTSYATLFNTMIGNTTYAYKQDHKCRSQHVCHGGICVIITHTYAMQSPIVTPMSHMHSRQEHQRPLVTRKLPQACVSLNLTSKYLCEDQSHYCMGKTLPINVKTIHTNVLQRPLATRTNASQRPFVTPTSHVHPRPKRQIQWLDTHVSTHHCTITNANVASM
jgi:hypothetical protein